MIIMAYAKTEEGAKKRVALKRALRKKGIAVKNNTTTANLKKMYKHAFPGKKFPETS